MKNSRNLDFQGAVSICLFLMFIIFLEACSTPKASQVKIDQAINNYIDTTLDCPPFSVTSCSQDSPYRDLLEKQFSSNAGNSKHYVNLLNFGEDALVARIHLIRAARKTIYLQTFTWGKDETSNFIYRELLIAARRGVQVKVLVDQYGMLGTGPKLELLAVAHSNLEVKVYNPILNKAHIDVLDKVQAGLMGFSKAQQRMHNKVMVMDNQIAIIGGRNIENKYFDMDPVYSFRDREVLVVGEVVQDMRRSFLDYWYYKHSISLKDLTDVGHSITGIKTTEPLRKLLRSPVITKLAKIDRNASSFKYIQSTFSTKIIEVTGRVAFFSDPPGKTKENKDPKYKPTLQARKDLFRQAKKSIVIQTPYLCFSEEGLDQFEQLQKQFPDLKIIVSTNSLATTDTPSIYAISLQQKKQLLKNLGIHIYELKPIPGDVRRMIRHYDRLGYENIDMSSNDLESQVSSGPKVGIHGKSFVLNDNIVWIGSANFDPRSDNINTEAALVIWDERVAVDVKDNILRDIEPQNSWVIAKRRKLPILSLFTGFMENLSRVLPIVDIWPFYYSTSYELRSGGTVVPSDHPDFHEHYKSVGSFPGLDSPLEEMKARPVRAFAGLAMPLI
jgi:putative cardiolipin synthase